MGTRKQHFFGNYETRIEGKAINAIVVAVKLPTGAVEIITNTVQLDSKMCYYDKAYDDDLKLKANPEIEIVDWMFA